MWVRKAEADIITALQLSRSRFALHDQVCFHCQQAAEKYLKALLEELSLPVPRVHDLANLLSLLLSHHSSLHPLRRGLFFLTTYAVEVRYPDRSASRRQAQAALRWADRVRATVRVLLGIRSRRQRRGKLP